MSNGSGGNNCVETVRSGENYYLLKAGEYELGPLAVMSAAEYQERLQRSRDNKKEWRGGEVTPNVAFMFMGRHALAEHVEHNTPIDQYVPEVVRTDGEVYAYGRTMDAGMLDELQDREQVIARENLSHLGEENPYALPHAA